MDPRPELLASNQRHVLEFFFVGLKDVSDPADLDRQELLYNASVLAHFAQVSTHAGLEFPTPQTLSDVFDHFVFDGSLRSDSEMMEMAGAQCWLLAGFFEDQMRARHNIRWYSGLGRSFFHRAAALERSARKSSLLGRLGRKFEPWRQRHAQLGRQLRDQPYMIKLNPPPEPS